jgi:hypothetical protein
VPFVGEEPGEDYDVVSGDIVELLDNSADVLYVKNRSKFFGGLSSQTNTQAIRSARRAISTRTQINIDGSIYAGEQLFGQKLLDMLVIGNGDVEMLRDQLHDQGESADPRFTLGPSGSPTGIHVGGRSDLYNWYRTLNYVEETVDIFAEMLTYASISIVDTEIDAVFVSGTTGTVPASGKLILEIGSTKEETVSYSSVSLNTLTGVYTFTLVDVATFSHDSGVSVRVSNTGEILIAPAGEISLLPLLQIASVRILDPVTFEPIGEPLPETSATSGTPGWYLTDHVDQNHMSANETKTLVIDEKTNFPGNPANFGNVDYGLLGGVTMFFDSGGNWSGYQGREIELTGGFGTVTRTVIGIVDPETVLLTGASLGFGSGTATISEAIAGNYNQYPVRVSFYTHTEIQELQDFLDEPRNRITTADIFSRAFFPVFVDFTYRYKGNGTEADVRNSLVDVIQTSAGQAVGESEGARFEYSDLVAAGYSEDLVNFVETPFEVKVTRVNEDGTVDIRYVNPGPNTVNNLSLTAALSGGELFITAERPASIDEFTMPQEGKLFLGAFTGTAETLEYVTVIQSGSSFTFVLREGQIVANAHGLGELIQVSVLDYEPDNVITDGVITDERTFRPYLGINTVVEKIE